MSSRPRGVCSYVVTCGLGAALVMACRPDVNKPINLWMSCIECTDRQRQNVEALGDDAVPALAVLLEFPEPRREGARPMIMAAYRPVAGLTADEYADLMLGAYVARHQIRSALSLGDIGTRLARRELEYALTESETRGYRKDVVRAIAGALARVTSRGFTGTLSPAQVNFGDTVRVHAGDVSWDGDESVEINGSPFGNEVLLNRFNTSGSDDSLEFVAVGEIGTYAVSFTRLGSNDIVQVDTALTIRSLRYDAHSVQTAEVLTNASLPQTRYLVLGSVGGLDTVDYIKVNSSVDLRVFATARWQGLGNINMSWHECAGPTAASPIVPIDPISRIVAPPDQLVITGASGTAVSIGATIQLSANKPVTWASSATNVATVDGTGLVTAVSAGTATIIATLIQDTNQKASVTITVAATAPAPDITPPTILPPRPGTVQGKIVSSNGSAVGGAQITVPGANLSTVSSSNGEFTVGNILPSADGFVTLQIDRIGFRPRTVRVVIGTSGHVFGIVSSSSTPATGMGVTSSGFLIGAGSCGLLKIWTPEKGTHQIIQLKLAPA